MSNSLLLSVREGNVPAEIMREQPAVDQYFRSMAPVKLDRNLMLGHTRRGRRIFEMRGVQRLQYYRRSWRFVEQWRWALQCNSLPRTTEVWLADGLLGGIAGPWAGRLANCKTRATVPASWSRFAITPGPHVGVMMQESVNRHMTHMTGDIHGYLRRQLAVFGG